jgi:uncharacterized membrane protein YphA (DoxX/SURF4 family)
MSRIRLTAAWILQILLAALFLLQSWMKLTGSPNWIARFRYWGYPEHFYLLIGLIELLSAIALLVPRLALFGASSLIVVMVGATVTHIRYREPQVIVTIAILVLLLMLFLLRRGSLQQSRT